MKTCLIIFFQIFLLFRSPLEKTRYETSLGLLTKKFVSLFHLDPSGTVDLNKETVFILSTSFPFNLNFRYVNQPTKLKKSSYALWYGSTEFPRQNLRQIGQGVHDLWSDIQTNKQRLKFLSIQLQSSVQIVHQMYLTLTLQCTVYFINCTNSVI